MNKKSNKGILFITYLFFALFLGLIVYLIYFYAVKSDEVINNPYNKRQDLMAEKVVRGAILADDAESKIAFTQVDDAGNETRVYPYGNMFSHVAGYIGHGGYGIENIACYYMLQSSDNIFDQIVNDLSGSKNAGDNIVTTLNVGLQRAAYDALGSNRGAIVVLEPSTGKILAMVSKPDFDPNTIEADWETITAEGADSVLFNRATQGLYPPGSTFKIVTMLEYLREHNGEDQYSYECDGAYHLGGETISCFMHTAHGLEDLTASFVNSCNASFINIGLSLDIGSYRKTAEDLLFNSELPVPIEYNQSQFVLSQDASEWDIAQTSFGQGETLISPMHLALIGSAIANDGVLMKPYLIDSVQNVKGHTVKRFSSSAYKTLMTKEESAYLTAAMERMLLTKYDWLYGQAPYTVAAKTGTAQYGTNGYEHSLFISFSPVEEPQIVVAVVIEGGAGMNTTAVETAKKVYDYYYQAETK